MKKTLQDQYLLIKEGKGHKDVFIKEAKRQFPGLIRNSATYTEVANVLKSKNHINENVIGLEPINQLQPSKKESYEVAFENFLAEAKKEHFDDEKAEVKKPSKQVEEDAEKNFDYEDKKNPDNLIFDQIMKGYYTEMKDPKNEDKTMEELKAIVFKNLEKNSIYYTEKGQFGVKDLGYTVEAPGLGEPKEPKGKYKASGYGDLKESKEIHEISGDEELKVVRVSRVTGGMNPILRVTFSDGYELKSSEINNFHNQGIDPEEYIDSKYLDLAYDAMHSYDPEPSIGSTSHEDLYTYESKENLKEVEETQLRKIVRSIINEELNNHQSVNDVDLSQSSVSLKENIEKELAEINKLAEYEIFESKLEKIAELIEKKSARLNRLDEDEDLKALTDKKKVKELQKDIKKLEKAKAKIEKALAKKAKSTSNKKEVIDEDESLEEAAINEAPPTDDLEKGKELTADMLQDLEDMADISLEEEDEEPSDRMTKIITTSENFFEKYTGRDNNGGNMSDGDALQKVLGEFPTYMQMEKDATEQHLMGKYDLGAA